MRRMVVPYSLFVVFLVVTSTVATVKAFLGGGVFFIVMAILTFVVACFYAFVTYKIVRKGRIT